MPCSIRAAAPLPQTRGGAIGDARTARGAQNVISVSATPALQVAFDPLATACGPTTRRRAIILCASNPRLLPATARSARMEQAASLTPYI